MPGQNYMSLLPSINLVTKLSPSFGKSNYAGWMDKNKDMGWSVFTHRLDGSHNLWGVGAINSAASGSIYISNFNKALQGADGGNPGMFTLKYAADGGFFGRINGGSLKEAVVQWLEEYDPSQPSTSLLAVKVTAGAPTTWQLVNL